MAWIPSNDFNTPWDGVDGTVLQASTTITASANTTGVEMGKGIYVVKIDVTAVHQESGFDNVMFFVESNTKGATSTWEQIASLPIGDATGVGVALGSTGVGTFPVAAINPNDNAIRLGVYVLGSTDSITYSAKIYPIRSMNAA
jgi:hypothetical protein